MTASRESRHRPIGCLGRKIQGIFCPEELFFRIAAGLRKIAPQRCHDFLHAAVGIQKISGTVGLGTPQEFGGLMFFYCVCAEKLPVFPPCGGGGSGFCQVNPPVDAGDLTIQFPELD